jgi:hypothetical protein
MTCNSMDILGQVTAAAGVIAVAAFGITIAGCVVLWVRYVFGGKS